MHTYITLTNVFTCVITAVQIQDISITPEGSPRPFPGIPPHLSLTID